jgi:hypothetical protein
VSDNFGNKTSKDNYARNPALAKFSDTVFGREVMNGFAPHARRAAIFFIKARRFRRHILQSPVSILVATSCRATNFGGSRETHAPALQKLYKTSPIITARN